MGSEQDNEDLKTLGSGLKTARESKGLSLKDVNEKTRISVSILDAIENDRFHLLPPGVYTRNFIRTYADFLGVDSQELLDHFTKEREQTAPPVLQKDDADISAVNHRRYWKVFAIGAVALILIGVLVWSLNSCWYAGNSAISSFIGEKNDEGPIPQVKLPNRDDGAVNSDKNLFIPAASSRTLPDALRPEIARPVNLQQSTVQDVYPRISASIPDSEQKAEENSGRYQLVIEAKERTWLQIRADDGAASQVILNPGERINRTAREHFILDIGNAAGVSVSFQGRKLENLGKRGQVAHLRLP